jgi:ParB family transcriptional regulator, chromosome partitioning protein
VLKHGYLLEHSEERLLVAVERGVMPAHIAMEIGCAPDGDVQQALAEAYGNKLLPGNQILAIRRIILQRNQRNIGPMPKVSRASQHGTIVMAGFGTHG